VANKCEGCGRIWSFNVPRNKVQVVHILLETSGDFWVLKDLILNVSDERVVLWIKRREEERILQSEDSLGISFFETLNPCLASI
jgi:hypothetical protein